MRPVPCLSFTLVLTLTLGCSRPAPATAATPGAPPAASFWQHWGDGQAELSGYHLVQLRYGEPRHGRAVLIYVTEPYSRSRQVKVDRYDPANPDHLNVLKLNFVRKFQTGVYDYSLMTSVFADPGAAFAPLKVTFSAQEWCGHVFEDLRFDGAGAALKLDSYFEGETEQRSLPLAPGTLSEDALFITLRAPGADALATEPWEGPLLPAATWRRLAHKGLAAQPAAIAWSAAPAPVTVPAGTFSARTATWKRADGVECSVDVEVAAPRHILGWRCGDGERAVMTGTQRLPYWKTHAEGDEKHLQGLGLRPSSYAP